MREMMTCAAALLVAACGAEATADSAVAATSTAATNEDGERNGRAPDHDFAGTYEGQPQEDDLTAEIMPTGPQTYKIGVSWGGMTAGGNYKSDGWEGTAKAQGNVLVIEREDWDGTKTNCTMTFKGGSRASYAMAECGGGDGNYRRTLLATASNGAASSDTEASAGSHWLVGAWAEQGGYCASDSTMNFFADATYRSGEFEGSWKNAGTTLTLRYQELEDALGEPSGPFQTSRLSLTKSNANELILSGTRYRRCPTRDGIEPWHPDVPFDTE